MPGYENQNVTHIVGENVFEQNRDLIGPDYNFSRHVWKDNGWNWLIRCKDNYWRPGTYTFVAVTSGLIHAGLWQHCIFQWTPTMTRLSRFPLFAIPTVSFWYFGTKWLSTDYGPKRQDKHTMHQLLNRVANSARYEAYKQQVEGLVGERA
mmetsp:Transcript_65737/g.104732  ORF Transcript_65737/g.104732 Transcript_65737/m.104732 type:complete len:150 (+) Transcript_65737:125-574(+)|eukprot:CAMPEP_0197028490 /NCGR_PEP_ID=MMETSP1384-20130603/8158_1 /TAXON_ID=29189 /ORGANISM="Ammonia sp." /LENGTH=149 /DNA_ID=CAMNT_0042457499 /DNA_START=120 /DNA_END=569 /DNA_ORIENTATION=-